MLGRSQLFSLVWCSSLGCGACYQPKRRFAAQTIKSSDPRHIGQAVPQHFNFAKDVLDQWSQLEKDGLRGPHPALWEVNAKGEEEKWSFERMAHLSQKAASVLADTCALGHGDRLMIILPPSPETCWICLACMRLGITFVPGTPQMTAKDILYRLHMSKAQCIVVNEPMASIVDSVLSSCPTLKTRLLVSTKSYDGWLDFKELIRIAPPKQTCVGTKSQDPMAIFFTNRTTGAPKLVEYSQYGLGMGCSQASRFGFSFLGAQALSRFPITTLCGNPGMYQELLHHKCFTSYRFKSLKHCVAAGGSISTGVTEEWKRITKLDIYEGYGQTETGLLCATSKRMKLKPGSVGKPLPLYIVQIVDENANILPLGEEGNIAVHIKRNQPASLYCPHMVGWKEYASARGHMLYLTGDRGIMDEDGYFWLSGRTDGVISTSESEVINAVVTTTRPGSCGSL
ncbi:PREDICTED: acyl-coenzyme A synthetase ACSM6, mitochondrial [Galeopterus variegatus]|uniref:medium-chain acyl-CoA ligase n=1 Tax=Galeopterus variegatus TaxID=482537 RepID=A0ABM0QTD7_GALVR|nr:PREDICTED: acyl-coenzyme A synthetase ACSM6, mitochondrial [Galeopterus variegatus]